MADEDETKITPVSVLGSRATTLQARQIQSLTRKEKNSLAEAINIATSFEEFITSKIK